MNAKELGLYKWCLGYVQGVLTGDEPDNYFCHLSVDRPYESGFGLNEHDTFSQVWLGDEDRDNYLFNGGINTINIDSDGEM